jgi:hypothetical protein
MIISHRIKVFFGLACQRTHRRFFPTSILAAAAVADTAPKAQRTDCTHRWWPAAGLLGWLLSAKTWASTDVSLCDRLPIIKTTLRNRRFGVFPENECEDVRLRFWWQLECTSGANNASVRPLHLTVGQRVWSAGEFLIQKMGESGVFWGIAISPWVVRTKPSFNWSKMSIKTKF